MATLKDIAQQVGVSITAASLVLNKPGGTKRVGTDTARRIRETANELGYRPDAAAQRLAREKGDLIGVVTHTISDFMSVQRLEASISSILASGCQPLLWCGKWSDNEWDRVLDLLLSNKVSGAILQGLEIPSDSKIAQHLINSEVATVSLDAGDGLPGAGVDRRDAFYTLTKTAIRAGHTHIGHLDVGRAYASALPRLEGIQDAIADSDERVLLSSFFPFGNGDTPPTPEEYISRMGFRFGNLGAQLFLQRDADERTYPGRQ